MAGTVIADRLEAASTSQLVIENGVANTPPTIVDGNNVQIGTFCRAWVNFNGTGTVAINASFNVTSITDNGTGDYTVNFTTAMPDVNYSISGGGKAGTFANTDVVCVGFYRNTASPNLTGSARINVTPTTGVAEDFPIVCFQVFR
jgi:hypothetical protein